MQQRFYNQATFSENLGICYDRNHFYQKTRKYIKRNLSGDLILPIICNSSSTRKVNCILRMVENLPPDSGLYYISNQIKSITFDQSNIICNSRESISN